MQKDIYICDNSSDMLYDNHSDRLYDNDMVTDRIMEKNKTFQFTGAACL